MNSAYGQFAPAPNQPGTTAVHKDSSIIVSWATEVEVKRGFIDINDTNQVFNNSNRASFGLLEDALGKAEGVATDCISLGDSGIAIVTFGGNIYNGLGPDLAIFENGFADNYMEFAFVEVSSDGEHFVRFPAESFVPLDIQIGPFEYSNVEQVNNLAGKYRIGFGTPFDLDELKDSMNIDVNHISHIKLIDVIGSITGRKSYDNNGNVINDCYPTPFASGGFDLDGIGVMYLDNLSLQNEKINQIAIYPNPSNDYFSIKGIDHSEVKIKNSEGRVIKIIDYNPNEKLSINDLDKGIYFIDIKGGINLKFIKD